MILYHASPSRIFSFIIPNENGLHLGSVDSAIYAAQRKSTSYYLYRCNVAISNPIDVEDCGYDWKSEIDFAAYQGYDAIRYRNKYEPSASPSYVIWDARKIISFELVGVGNADHQIP